MSTTEKSTADIAQPVIDLTTVATSRSHGPTLDLRSPSDGGRRWPSGSGQTRPFVTDLEILANALIDREMPAALTIDLTVADLTVVVDETDTGRLGTDTVATGGSVSNRRTQGTWALHDRSPIGCVITPRIVATARRVFDMMGAGRPLITSPGTYFQSHRRFSADYVHRNLASLIDSVISDRGDCDDMTDAGDFADRNALTYAGQYRLEYFVGLPADEFEACFRFNGEITREYLLHAERCDRLYAERLHPSPMIPAADRRRRKAASLQQR